MTGYLVTGGAGFIGHHIVRALVAGGHSVRVVDNLSTGRRSNLDGLGVEFIEGDIRDAALCREVCAGIQFVFHQAAFVSVPASIADPVACHEVNVTGSLNVFRAAADAGVRRVVYASSCAVYGDTDKPALAETDAGALLSPYAASKFASELYGRVFPACYGLDTVGLRYFNVFGPRQDPNSPYAAVIPLFAKAFLDGVSPTIFGDGEQTRDFVYVDNVVSANLKAAHDAPRGAHVFNVGTGVGTSVNRLAELVRAELASDLRPVHAGPRAGDIRHSRATIDLAVQTLDYTPAISLEDGLARTVRAYRKEYEALGA